MGQFHGGIHPPSRKDRTKDLGIIDMPMVDKIALPLAQHSGQAALCSVKVGDSVSSGQIIGHSDGFVSANVLAPLGGIVSDITQYPASHPSGLNTETVVIKTESDALESWEKLSLEDDNQLILDRIKQSGITGLGGASFPTSVKLSPRKSIDLLLINGAECEPYITADDALMRAHSEQIIAGIMVMNKLLTPQRVVIAIEDNKPQAIKAMENAASKHEHIVVRPIPTLYPAGGEKQLIEVITGHQVPSGKIPADIGVVVQNVATAHAIADVVFHGKPLLSRVVTVTGDLVERPGNYRVYLGTPIIDLLNFCGFKAQERQKIIMGGPMMGFALQNLDAPVVKATNCIIAASNQELPDAPAEQNCIRCGDCEQVCPAQLLPQQLQWFAKDKDHDKLQQHNLFDCIECGACAYVCPAHIPLVQYYRVAKAEIREAHQEQLAAQRAKERYEQRQARLEREKQEREERNRLANERRKAAMAKNNDGDAIAAALARVKAKKAGTPEPAADTPAKPQNDRVAAAIARAKAKKAAAAGEQAVTDTNSDSPAPINPDKARVSDAIARAKAKKAAKAAQASNANNNVAAESSAAPESGDDKKARIAAAVAKAKAKKAAQATDVVETAETAESTDDATASTPADDKKARIAAAVAKAKAKKAAQAAGNETANKTVVEAPNDSETSTPADDKKARIAAAVAKAKAKKAAQAAGNETADETVVEAPVDSEASTPADDKKARIAAAVAKAKAKKAAQAADTVETTDDAPTSTPADDKKARITAAVAKAKAKKAAKEAGSQTNDDSASDTQQSPEPKQAQDSEVETDSESTVTPANEATPADEKKARIAAAVAKAKAKKAARDSQTNDK
nr:electron transport complex subunit RsxC [Psychrobium sp. MM17-31]